MARLKVGGLGARPGDELDRPWTLPKVPGETEADHTLRYLEAEPAREIYVLRLLVKRYRLRRDDPDFWKKFALEVVRDYVPARTASVPGPGRPARRRVAYEPLYHEIDKRLARTRRKNEQASSPSVRAITADVAEEYGCSVSGLRDGYSEWRKIRR